MAISSKSVSAFIVSVLLAAAGQANAVTWEITGTITNPSNADAPDGLRDINGTSFTAYLSYDETTPSTSMLSPQFYNYTNEGSIELYTAVGSAKADFLNLQTFIMETPEGRGSNFNGSSFDVTLEGSESFLSLVPVSIDFQFQQTVYGAVPGLVDFSLPSHLNVADFDGGNLVRLTFATDSDHSHDISVLGSINGVSPIPEPATYAMFAGGLFLLGWRIRMRA